MDLMMDILLWLGAVLWILLFIQLIVNRALALDLSRTKLEAVKNPPLISIIVPARNEERSIREAVASFCTQDYPLFEVLVVDDRSTDATPQILAELRTRFSNLKVIGGRDPPDDWLGKPNALEIGRKEAKGQWLLFVDADVVYAPDLLSRAIAYVVREKADMLFLPWPPQVLCDSLTRLLGGVQVSRSLGGQRCSEPRPVRLTKSTSAR